MARQECDNICVECYHAETESSRNEEYGRQESGVAGVQESGEDSVADAKSSIGFQPVFAADKNPEVRRSGECSGNELNANERYTIATALTLLPPSLLLAMHGVLCTAANTGWKPMLLWRLP
jgi:hypothetical protein